MLSKKKSEAGFSYIDVLIAIVILMVGILAMLSALTANLIRSYESEKRIVAKQMVVSTIESIISAKEIKNAGVIEGWDSIRNFAGLPAGEIDGIFLTGFLPIREEIGGDGAAGTADDACASGAPCVTPTSPTNNSAEVEGYQRRILITDVEDPERPFPENAIARRRIDVTIRFVTNAGLREETMSTIVANY
ncbi:MAG: hypothetical protein H7070_12980 [Saprospiraceae bacterium]|nr:hypothetical protein [Pyrinomonadaceae bacterium]